MKKTLLLIFLFYFTTLVNAQLSLQINSVGKYEVSYSYTNQNNRLVNASLGFDSTPFSKNKPGHILWVEYGDGKFTFQPVFQHFYSNNVISNPIIKASAIYEGGNKPTRIISSAQMQNTGRIAQNSLYEANNIPSGKNVSVTPNINSISHGDTMHFAVSYILPDDRKDWKLIFEYNLDEEAFEQTTEKDFVIDHENNSLSVPFVRTHNNEKPYYDYNKIEFPELIETKAGQMQTVFITLIPKTSSTSIGNITAYLKNDNDPKSSESNRADLSMSNFGPGPHDPNFVKVDKKCVLVKRKDIVLNYQVHFQNTGLGPCNDSVRVAVKLPDDLTNLGIPLMSKVTLKNANYSGFGIVTMLPFNSKIKNTSYNANTLYYDNLRSDSLVFNFVISTLAPVGSNTILHPIDLTNPNFMNDKKTMGDIEFSVALPPYKRSIKIAQAAIVFDTEHPVETEKEPTKVRYRCRKRNNADCKCGGKKRKFLEWLKEKCD
jgi:hypothetical protein